MAKKRNVYKGGPKARKYDLFSPDLGFTDINPQLVNAFKVSDKFLRSEYSRLRAIANKRIKRMEGKPEAEGTYSRLPEQFPSVRGMDRAEVVRALGDVSRFLTADRGSLSGIHKSNKEIKEALEKKGISVPEDQLARFGHFMNAMKKALGLQRGDYGSEQLANLWQELFDQGKISKAEFERKVKTLMDDLNYTYEQMNRKQDPKDLKKEVGKRKREVNKILRESPIDTFFDELALDPRTVKAKAKRDSRSQEKARQAKRRATVARRRRRMGD